MDTAKTAYGTVRGVQREGYIVFRGIPYAAPPVGPLRFAPPAPPASWEGVRTADVFPAMAPQPRHPPGSFYHKEFYADEKSIPAVSEDCLYLNIWTPARDPGERLPVAFWVHGGAFRHGHGHEIEFDGGAFCHRGVILVTLQYRLGALGFLAHPWFGAENGANGNWGLLDQIAALRWVRENIAAFGGDPDRITLMGQSAGAFSVQAIMCSPLATGLFAGVILQSGGGYRNSLMRDLPLAVAEETGLAFQRAIGADTLPALRAAPVEAILSAQEGLRFAPAVDGHVITRPFDETMAAGKHADVPYLLGCTADDLWITPEDKAAGNRTPLYQGYINWSFLQEKLGWKPAYVYYFARRLPGDDAGAFHSSELWYMFGTLERCWRPMEAADHALSREMVDCWANFVKNGDPNGDGLPDWPACRRGEPFVRVFG